MTAALAHRPVRRRPDPIEDAIDDIPASDRFRPSRLLQSAMKTAAQPVRIGGDPSPTTGLPQSSTTPRRALVLMLAGITAATEVAFVAGYLPALQVSDLPISIALLPALVLAVACGPRLLGRSTVPKAAALYWATVIALVPLLGCGFAHIHHAGWFAGLLGAALGEELIYRLAVPAVIAAALRLGNVRPDIARITGLVGAGVWFVLLPGHREQMTGTTSALPFVAFAALSAFIVFRSGSILPMAIAHAVSNLLTVLMWQGAISSTTRSLGLGFVLILLVTAYGRTSRITLGDDGDLVDTKTGLAVRVIDLRDGRPATVELADGRILVVHGNLALPDGLPLRSGDQAEELVPADLAEIASAARSRVREREGAAIPTLHHPL
jgi:hypothetical protein